MRFEYYHSGLDAVPKLSVDGTVPNSVHFSHWQGNETPAALKADTSTEIALNLVGARDPDRYTHGINLVTNNHFDTDGILSVWTVLTGERALELRDKLIPAAEAGDFSELSSEDAVRASIVIQGSDQASPNDDSGSPAAAYFAGEKIDDDARAYELVLPHVERIVTHTEVFEELWREPWNRIALAVESFEKGASNVEEFDDASVSLVMLAPSVFSHSGFDPTRHSAPCTAITKYARGRVFVIATPLNSGWAYRVDYPYYSWAETVVRPRIHRHDLSPLTEQLNEAETSSLGRWKLDSAEMTSAVKFADGEGRLAASTLPPDQVAVMLRNTINAGQFARVAG